MRQDMKILTSMSTGRWFTPPHYIEKVKEVLGFIHLDPASEPAANEIVGADMFFTEDDDGLIKPWKAETVFLNPPYSKEGERKATTPKWVDKAISEYHKNNFKTGIILVNAKLGYNWFNDLIDNPYVTVLLHRERMRFIDAKTMKESKPSRQPQASIYMGFDGAFFSHFLELGWLVG